MKEKVGRCCNIYRLKKTLDNASPSIKINNNNKVYKKTDFLRPVDKKVKTATIFVVKTRS